MSPTCYSPVRHSRAGASSRLAVRLACLRRAASVRSEPGSNSPWFIHWPQGPVISFQFDSFSIVNIKGIYHTFVWLTLSISRYTPPYCWLSTSLSEVRRIFFPSLIMFKNTAIFIASLSQVKLVYHTSFHFVKHFSKLFQVFFRFRLVSRVSVFRCVNDEDYITLTSDCQA